MAGWSFFLNGTEVEEPIGWDAVEFTAKRMESHGMDQPFSTELAFDGIGARLIKAHYDAHFINANITLLITSDVKVNGTAWSYVGYLDLSIYSEKNVCDTDSWEITVGILEDNFREQFKARMDVEIDLLSLKDLNQNAIPALTFHETRLHCQELYLVASAANLSIGTGSIYPDDLYSTFFSNPYQMPFYFDNSDFKGIFGDTFNPTGTSGSYLNVLLVNNDDQIRTYRWAGAYDIDGYYIFADPISLTAFFYVKLVVYDTSLPAPYIYSSVSLGTSGPTPYTTTTNLSGTFDELVTLLPNQRATIQVEWLTPSPIANAANNRIDLTVNSCCLNITESNGSEYASLSRGLLIKNYLERIVYILTGQSNNIISDYFEPETGCEWANMLTTGLYIRNAATIDTLVNGCGNTEEGSQFYSLKTSFKKIFENLSRIFCLGWQYEQQPDLSWKIRIEPVDYFYQANLMATFEDVGDIRRYAMTDKLVNNVTVGYSDKWKNIAVSGIFEIHTERNYFIKNKAISAGSTAKLDLKSDIIASGYAIEFSRRLQFLRDDSGSSDRPNDYETFIIALNSGSVSLAEIAGSGYGFENESGPITFAPGEVSYGSNFIAVSNAPIGRIYNIPLTPMRNAIRWWKMLGMHTFGLDAADAKLFFQVGEYYTTYSSEIISSCLIEVQEEVLAENIDISVDIIQPLYQEYIFKPIAVEFEYPQTLCDFIGMGDPGNGIVQFTSGNVSGLGFIQESANKPEDPSGGTTKFTLILSNKTLPTGRPYSDGYSDGFE